MMDKQRSIFYSLPELEDIALALEKSDCPDCREFTIAMIWEVKRLRLKAYKRIRPSKSNQSNVSED